MKNEVHYKLQTGDGDRKIIIKPVNLRQPGNNLKIIGVFSLREGAVDMGDIVFDDKMKQWEYTGMGNLTHTEAEQIALFIKKNKTVDHI
jgi:hypothetical protein